MVKRVVVAIVVNANPAFGLEVLGDLCRAFFGCQAVDVGMSGANRFGVLIETRNDLPTVSREGKKRVY